MAYLVPCVRFNDVVRPLMSEVCVPGFPRYLGMGTGSLKLLTSPPQRRGFLYSTVTSLTGRSGLLHHCNTRYDWLVRPCSTGTFTLQETPSFAWRTNALRVSRAATFPKCASTRSTSHNQFARRYHAAERRRTARACWAASRWCLAQADNALMIS